MLVGIGIPLALRRHEPVESTAVFRERTVREVQHEVIVRFSPCIGLFPDLHRNKARVATAVEDFEELSRQVAAFVDPLISALAHRMSVSPGTQPADIER